MDGKRWVRIKANTWIDGNYVCIGTWRGPYDEMIKEVRNEVGNYLRVNTDRPFEQRLRDPESNVWQFTDDKRNMVGGQNHVAANLEIDDPTERLGYSESEFLKENAAQFTQIFEHLKAFRTSSALRLLHRLAGKRRRAIEEGEKRVREYVQSGEEMPWRAIADGR